MNDTIPIVGNNKSKLVWCWWGNNISLGFYGTFPQSEQFFNFLYNHQATESDPIPVSENFSYVLTSWPKLERGVKLGLLLGELHKVRNEPRKTRSNLYEESCIKTQAFLDILQPEEFLSLGSETAIEPYNLAEEVEINESEHE